MFTFATPFFYIGLGSEIRDPRSGIRDEQILGSGSGIRDKTSRIRNTAERYRSGSGSVPCQNFTDPENYRTFV
jgi:hypothetical protein